MSNANNRAGLPHRPSRLPLLGSMVCMAPLLLAGCAAFPSMTAEVSQRHASSVDGGSPRSSANEANLPDDARNPPERLRIPGSGAVVSARQPATEAQIAALIPDEMVDAALAPQSIPQFAATVFGGLLQVPYTLNSDVATRTEFISGGTGGTISKRVLFRLTQQALKQYGIDVYIDGSAVTIGSTVTTDIGAQVARDRNVSSGAGRVVQFFNVQTIEVNTLQSLLQDLFPNLGGARVTPDPLSNSLIISGPGREVAQVVRVLREIDQPRFAGAEVLRVEPVYWSAENFANSLEQVLTTEGYVVSRQAAAGRSIVILPFPTANQILIFTRDAVLQERVRYWIENLDRPAALGDKPSTFVYQVRRTDAASVGQLAMGQAPATNTAQPPVGVPGSVAADSRNTPARNVGAQAGATNGSGGGAGSGQFMNGRILTDPIGNRIIFTGTATEFAQLRTLLDTLDVAAPQVVIEVMIAEVTLTDSTKLGVSLFGTQARGDGILGGSTEGLDLGTGAGVFTFVGADYRAKIVANASNNKINILQRPQLVTRSGGTARFQVGTDVPIITSQRATDFQSGNGSTDVLQSVQYRQTGTILEIKPVVYGDRVDITISQELSSASAPPAGSAIASPTILNRSLTTQIAISDGWTGVLGGLISNNYTKNNVGLPFLKDIPIIGSAFQTNSVSGDRTELLLMITPYIIRGDEDMADFAGRYANDMNAAFRTGRSWSYTLTPFSLGRSFRGVGLDLPSADRASERQPLFPRRGGGDQQPAASDAPAATVSPEAAPAQPNP